MAKKQTKSAKSQEQYNAPLDSFGIGYHKPDNLTASQLHKLHKFWQNKLAQSGFNDIETPAYGKIGRVTPYFRRDGSSMNGLMAVDTSAQAYYSMARAFYHDFDWTGTFRHGRLMRFIWRGVSEGVPYRIIVRRLAGLPVNARHAALMPKPIYFYKIRQARSLYWLYCRIHEIMPHFKTYCNETA